jgi:hypothetical protein
MHATRDLPANYQSHSILDLSSARVVLQLNIAAIPLLFLYGWIFSRLMDKMRSFYPFTKGVFGFLTSFSGWQLVALLLSIILMLVLHELIHGVFFWFFTHDRPRFALKSGYAFAAAPEWFLPRSEYMLVGLSPFILITIFSLILAWIANPALNPYLLLVASFNAAGSLGDMIVAGWALKQPDDIFIKDEGDVFESYSPGIQ